MRRKEKIILQNTSLFGIFGHEISFTLRLIPSGWYYRGGFPKDIDVKDIEKPNHKVQIIKPFWMMETQVTEELYLHINPTRHYKATEPKFPVRNICWYDAIRFCNKLSKKCKLPISYDFTKKTVDAEGFETTKITWNRDSGFRLPTEAEWEWAARALSSTKFAGSTTLEDVGFYDQNSKLEVSMVQQKLPNNWGIYDMSGNVDEWCWDWFENYVQCDDKGFINPKGPRIGTRKIVRGGSWNAEHLDCRVTARRRVYPASKLDYIGFRCIITATGK